MKCRHGFDVCPPCDVPRGIAAAAKPRRPLIKRARVARRLADAALAEINRACRDEVINQSKPIGRAVEYLNAIVSNLKED